MGDGNASEAAGNTQAHGDGGEAGAEHEDVSASGSPAAKPGPASLREDQIQTAVAFLSHPKVDDCTYAACCLSRSLLHDSSIQ